MTTHVHIVNFTYKRTRLRTNQPLNAQTLDDNTSWRSNELVNKSAIKFVQSIEIQAHNDVEFAHCCSGA